MNDKRIGIYKTMQNERLEKTWRSIENNNGKLSPFMYFDYVKNMFCMTKRWKLMYKPLIFTIESATNGRILMIIPLQQDKIKGKLKMLGDQKGCGNTDILFTPDMNEEEAFGCLDMFFGNTSFKLKLRRINENSI